MPFWKMNTSTASVKDADDDYDKRVSIITLSRKPILYVLKRVFIANVLLPTFTSFDPP